MAMAELSTAEGMKEVLRRHGLPLAAFALLVKVAHGSILVDSSLGNTGGIAAMLLPYFAFCSYLLLLHKAAVYFLSLFSFFFVPFVVPSFLLFSSLLFSSLPFPSLSFTSLLLPSLLFFPAQCKRNQSVATDE